MGRFFDILNTPIAVLGVLFVVVAVNLFLYFGYRSSEAPTSPPAEPTTTIERTERTGPKEETRPATTVESTIPTEQSTTVSATASPTASPSP